MPQTWMERAVALLGVVTVLLAVGLTVFKSSDRAEGDGAQPAVPAPEVRPLASKERPRVRRQKRALDRRATREVSERRPRPRPRRIAVTLTAARGDCWLSVRKASSVGRVLYEGTLAEGGSVRFSGERLWIRFGAAANVDLRLSGKSIRIPAGTLDVIATADGIVPAAVAGSAPPS